MRDHDPGTTVDLVFDADCVLCSGAVHFVLAHERAPTIRFINAWSNTGLALAARHGLTRADLDTTFLVVRDGCSLLRSDAALAIAQELRAPWSWVRWLRILPRPLRDAAYTLVAKRRYRWFGQRPNCFRPLPAQAQAHRFVDDQPAEINR